MKEKEMYIDYRESKNHDGTVKFIRKTIDNFEFCVREGMAYFMSGGQSFQVPLECVSQIYTA